MKKIIKKILLFIIPILIIGLFLEVYLRKTKNIYELKANQLIENSNNINLLILGNSHATYGVDPNQFDLFAFNAAQVSQSIYFDKRITLKYLDQLRKLKFVLISVDFHSLYFSSQDIRNNLSFYGYGIPFEDNHSFISQNCYLKGYTPKLATTSIMKYVLLKKYDNKLYAVDLEEGVDIDKPMQKGWFAYKSTDINAMQTSSFFERANGFNKSAIKCIEKKAVLADLEDFIIKLQQKNIQPILFTSPCYVGYSKFLNKNIQNQNTKDINYLTKKFKIEYWNYLDLPLQQSDFYNCDHLNGNGARKFSILLNQRLKTSSIN